MRVPGFSEKGQGWLLVVFMATGLVVFVALAMPDKWLTIGVPQLLIGALAFRNYRRVRDADPQSPR